MKNCRSSYKKIDKKISRQYKSFKVYKLQREKGGISQYSGRRTIKEFKAYFGINRTNRVVGFTPDYIGVQPGGPVISKNYFTKFLLNKKILTRNNLITNQLKESLHSPRIVFKGSYSTCTSHLQKICRNDETELTAKEILEKLSVSGFGWFSAPAVEYEDSEEMLYQTIIKGVSSSGHYTSKLAGRNKASSFSVNYAVATEIFEDIKVRPTQNYYLWQIFSREKDIKEEGEYEEVGTRAVLNPEGPVALLLTWFAQKMSYVVNRKTTKFNLKGKFDVTKNQSIDSNRRIFDYELEADWSNFDASIDGPFIEAGCAILLSNIKNQEVRKRIAYYIYKSIRTKNVAFPPGVVVEINRYMPSGHPFGSLINCTINLIYWSLIGMEIYGEDFKEYMDIEVYGDDAKVFFKSHPNLDKIDEIVKKIGLKSEPLLPKLFFLRKDYNIHDLPDFLKRRYMNGEIVWNRKKIFDRIIYQTKRRGLSDQIDLAYSYVTTAPQDSELRELICEYFEFLKKEERISLNDLKKIELIEDDLKFENFLKNYDFRKVGEKMDSYKDNQKILDLEMEVYLRGQDKEVTIDVPYENYLVIKSLSKPIKLINKQDSFFSDNNGVISLYNLRDKESLSIKYDRKKYYAKMTFLYFRSNKKLYKHYYFVETQATKEFDTS